MKPELKHRLVNIGSAASAGVGSLVSPSYANAESPAKLLALNDPVFLQGDGRNNNHLKTLLIGQNGATLPMLEEVKDDLFSISPMDEFRLIMDVAGILGGNELGCDQNAQCDWRKVNEVIKGYLARGLVFHEAMVVIKSNDGGGTGFAPIFPSHLSKPDIYSPSAVVRPVDTRGSNREVAAGTVVHEFLHQFAGFNHEGNDIMQRICNCINEQHARFLRSLKPLVPYNYLTPTNEVKLSTASLSLKADITTPIGTTQQYRRVIPFNNDGPGMELIRNAESSFRIPPPPEWYGLLPDMTYTWTECSSGLNVPLTKDDQRWTQAEGWPGIWFPNPCDVKQLRTPKRFADGIGLITLAGGQETNNLRPTLVWNNRDSDVFYYEVQVSKDPDFGEQGPKAMVYGELRHGGVTNPQNSYTIPKEFPLEQSTTYFWRVRPRVQGDGTPVAFSARGLFKTTQDARVLAQGELEVIRNGTNVQAKKVISSEEHLRLQEEIRKEEQKHNESTSHWQWVEREVLTRTRIPIFKDNGEILTWVDHSDNIPVEAYRREDQFPPTSSDLAPAA